MTVISKEMLSVKVILRQRLAASAETFEYYKIRKKKQSEVQ